MAEIKAEGRAEGKGQRAKGRGNVGRVPVSVELVLVLHAGLIKGF